LLNNTKSINCIHVNKKHKIFFIQKKDYNHQGQLMMFSNTYIFTIIMPHTLKYNNNKITISIKIIITNYFLSIFFYFIGIMLYFYIWVLQ